jgi:hypothetical protein
MKVTEALCIHRQLAERTHEFRITEASIPAVDSLFKAVDRLMSETPYPRNLSLLIDTSVGVQPIGYCLTQMRQLARKYPKREPTRIAFILNPSSPFKRMLDIFMRQFGAVRFFEPDQREEAVAWLLAEQS